MCKCFFNISSPARAYHIIEIDARDFDKAVHKFKNRNTGAGTKVEYIEKILTCLSQVFQRAQVSFCNIQHMNVVAYTRSIRCVVVIAKDNQFLTLANGSLGDVGNEIARHSDGKFAQEP